MKILSFIFLFAGLFFVLVATIGVIRMPDFYTRIHASGKSETLGVFLCMLGLALYNGLNLTSVKILFIAFFIFLFNPIGTHIITRAAYLRGDIPPYTKGGDKA